MDFFETQKAQMLARFGPQGVHHPHAGTLGHGLNAPQTLASINPAFQDPQAYAHITRDYSTPITIHEEPLEPACVDMEIDTLE
jgi:hypothetical protein